MKKETLFFVLASFGLMVGYLYLNSYFIDKNKKESQILAQTTQNVPVKQELQSSSVANPTTSEAPIEPQSTPDTSSLGIEETKPHFVKTAEFSIEITPEGGCFGKNTLNQFTEKLENKTTRSVSVIQNYQNCKALGFRVGDSDLRTSPAKIFVVNDEKVNVVQSTPSVQIKRSFEFGKEGPYSLRMNIEVKNLTNSTQNTNIDFEMGATSDNKSSGGIFSSTPMQFQEISYLIDGSVSRETLPFDSAPSTSLLLEKTSLFPKWIAADSLYWVFAVLPTTQTSVDLLVKRTGFNIKKDAQSEIDQTIYEGWVRHKVSLAPQSTTQFSYIIYMGPKDESTLTRFSSYDLSSIIDYGFFKIVAKPIYYLLDFLHSVVNNWGLAIIILTLLINIILIPLQIKGFLSGKKLQEIQPEMKKIQELYANDKAKLQQETMALMSKSGVNPMSGCLPMLPQIPIFFGLNSALMHTFELRQAPFAFWLQDLSIHDPYFLLPLIMVVLMILSQKMIPMPSMDPTQAKLLKVLPLIFGVFMVFYPSGLSLYVITNTLFSIARQKILMTKYSSPTVNKVEVLK